MNLFTNTWRRIFPPKTEDPPRTPVKPLNGHAAHELVHRNNVYTHGERVLCNGASGSLYHSPAEMQWYHVQDDGEVKSVAGSDKITRLLAPDVVAADIAPLDTRELPDGLVWAKPTAKEIITAARQEADNEAPKIKYTPFENLSEEDMRRAARSTNTEFLFPELFGDDAATASHVVPTEEFPKQIDPRTIANDNAPAIRYDYDPALGSGFAAADPDDVIAATASEYPDGICYMNGSRNLRFRATYGSGKHRVTKNCANLHDAITTREAFEVAAKKWRVR